MGAVGTCAETLRATDRNIAIKEAPARDIRLIVTGARVERGSASRVRSVACVTAMRHQAGGAAGFARTKRAISADATMPVINVARKPVIACAIGVAPAEAS